MIFISPPFGNYFNYGNYVRLSNVIAIKGSFTLNAREGKWLQIIKTLRYSFRYGGWVNRIGLRNPGLDYALKNYRDDVISIAILEDNEINKILNKLPENQNIEINISCPNVEKRVMINKLYKFVNPKREWCIIKLSPLTKMDEIEKLYNSGFRHFHCCNTLLTDEGSLSGRSLIHYNTKLIKKIKNRYSDVEIIAGGGIQCKKDVEYFRKLGAEHFSVSSLLFNPIKFYLFLLMINR